MVAAALAMVAAACSNSTGGNSSGGNTAPGVTSNSIILGSLATESGPLAAEFSQAVYGAKAYFAYINSQGGVAGHKIDLKYEADDTGSPTNDTTQARNLVEQDHVFAVVAVGTPFFSGASFLKAEDVPTFGYVVTTDWNNALNEFGAYGSYLAYNTSSPIAVYVARQLHATSVGVLAYNIAASSEDACASVVQGLASAGIHVGYQDLAYPYGGNPTPDVLQMKAAHVDLVISCMEGSDNLQVDESMHQNGMSGFHSEWLTGYDRGQVAANASVMQGVIYLEQHVPFEAATAFPGKYPGMETYLNTMAKYEPKYKYNELSMQGYINAVQFVQGLKEVTSVGEPITRQNLINAINKETAFTGGLTTPVNWTNAHTSAPPPYCSAFVEVGAGGTLTPVFVQKNDEVFVCANSQDEVISPLPGTPGL